MTCRYHWFDVMAEVWWCPSAAYFKLVRWRSCLSHCWICMSAVRPQAKWVAARHVSSHRPRCLVEFYLLQRCPTLHCIRPPFLWQAFLQRNQNLKVKTTCCQAYSTKHSNLHVSTGDLRYSNRLHRITTETIDISHVIPISYEWNSKKKTLSSLNPALE